MVGSPHPGARGCSCRLLRSLARYKSIAPAILELELCEQLVFLLDDNHSGIIREASAALSQLAGWFHFSNVIVSTKVLHHVLVLLESPNPKTRKWVCELVGHLASREYMAPAILKLNIPVHLVSLLGDEDYVVRWATYALSQIARWVDGAKGVVDAKALDYVLRLLESPNLETRTWACYLTASLASHESTAPAILKLNPSMQLVSSLGDEGYIVRQAIYALSRIARWPDGAKAVVDAKVLDHVHRLLKSPNPYTRRWACGLAGQLALHESTAPATLNLNPSVQLVSLLGDEDSFSRATYALTQIARWVDGAKAVVDAKALDHILTLLQSPNPYIRTCACELTGNLASHESTAPAILKLNPSVQLVSLLGDENSDSLVPWVTLSQIARWVNGAKAVVDAKALDHVLALLDSPIPSARKWACELLGNLVKHRYPGRDLQASRKTRQPRAHRAGHFEVESLDAARKSLTQTCDTCKCSVCARAKGVQG
ncbi:armadillo-type protein [Mycena olivaceomarginata]|nr:armadillo-type protein [Mycena olivaceomarginata]